MTREGASAAAAADLSARVTRAFERRFGGPPPLLARAPGRVNLIGDHTDYNDGFVLPMAIDRATWIAARPRQDRRVVVHSLDYDETESFELDDDARRAGWIEYVRGVAWALAGDAARLEGWEGVCAGNVPVGAGLSSSASIELAAARAFAAVSAIPWDATAMARVAQRAESGWVGVSCGIMDQLISASGVAGHALLIDCRSLQARPVPLPGTASIVVLDTTTRRGLVSSAYNERRMQCEAAATAMHVVSLRDATLAALDSAGDALDAVTRRRARHVITESARTVAAAEALTRGELGTVGRLMNESHASLRDDFEVSRPELDAMVQLAQEDDACFGARMTGAGFGGCAVALVDHRDSAEFCERVAGAYASATGLRAQVYVCTASGGAALLPAGL